MNKPTCFCEYVRVGGGWLTSNCDGFVGTFLSDSPLDHRILVGLEYENP